MTRKIIVPIAIEDPTKKINDFLYPAPVENGFVLRGINSGKEWKFGMVVLTSEINEQDIYKKIVARGKNIESNDQLLLALKAYVSLLPNFKIGNVVRLNEKKECVDFVIEYQRLTRRPSSQN